MGGAAIFDLDRTITRVGTFTPFLLSTRPKGPRRAALTASFLPHMALYKAGSIDRKALKNRMMAIALRDLNPVDIADHAERFVVRVMTSGLYADALTAIARHRANGDTLILATASIDIYARLFSKRLGFDDYIATATGVAAADAPPQILGENCYGYAKHDQVMARLDQRYGGGRDMLRLSFYSDHISDLPLLQAVDAAYVVNPKSALRAHAGRAGWPVCSWTALERKP